jgi:hypothetical protein
MPKFLRYFLEVEIVALDHLVDSPPIPSFVPFHSSGTNTSHPKNEILIYSLHVSTEPFPTRAARPDRFPRIPARLASLSK